MISLLLLLALISFHILLLSKIIFFPYPELFVYSYLTREGLLPYKQILDQHFPGLMFFPINLATLGMDTPEEARLWLYGAVILTHLLLFLVARKLFKSNLYGLLSNLLYLIWQPFFEGYVLWIDSFVPIFLLTSFHFLLDTEKHAKSYFFAGLFLGVSLLFKQPAIIIFLLLTFSPFLYTKRDSVYKFLVGFSIPVLILIIYMFKIGVLRDFIYWAGIFNLTVFAEMGRKYPAFSDLAKSLPVFGYAILLSIYLIFRKATNSTLLTGIFFLGSLSFAFARFDFVHLQPALPFALIITVLSIKKLKSRYFFKAIICYLLLISPMVYGFYKFNSYQKVFFFGEFERELSSEVEKLTDPGDSVFAMGTTFHIYQMTKTLPPGRIFVFQFPWFMKVAEGRVFAGILNDPPKVVIRDRNSEVSGMNLVSYMPRIESYVDKFYVPIKKIENTEILIRR